MLIFGAPPGGSSASPSPTPDLRRHNGLPALVHLNILVVMVHVDCIRPTTIAIRNAMSVAPIHLC